jgi:MinD-like ATPase involved in chromosome partitioning or flagellar assembly/DNA-binding response OmpR family regulator
MADDSKNYLNRSIPKMLQNGEVQRSLLTYLRHELCTPINGMIGYSELLLEELQAQPESSLFEDLQKIYGCSKQLLTLVTAILDPVQLEMSQIDGDLSSFGSTLRTELLTPLSTIIGYCEMSLEEAPARLIPDLDKLNASAQQLLSLVNDIINLAQQQLQTLNAQANSNPELSLDSAASTLVQSATSTLETLSQMSAEKQSQGGMILVVDDNPTNCDLLSRQLKRQGYAVTTAINAQQALRLLKAVPYDLILLDLIMPGMNGIELLQQLKRHDDWRHIPVIMISALDEIDGAVKCIELGAEDYLHKPFDPTLLKARIGAYLEKKRLRDQEILYLQQVKRLTTAAAAVETNTFNPDSLNDLIQHPGKLGQLARVFQQMAQEVHSREQQLEQQVHLLQVTIDNSQKKRVVAEIAATEHFRQLQKRTKGSRDIENLYRSSLYPPLSRFASMSVGEVSQGKDNSESSTVKRQAPIQIVKRSQQSAIAANSGDNRSSKIVAVHSFRGGTGKSNLTSNLAIAVAKQGKRVGIIDTDLQSPGIHVLFGLDEETIDRTLNDYLWGDCALQEAAYDLSHLLPKPPAGRPGRIHLIPASAKANDITRILREGYHQELMLDGFSEIIRDLQLDYLFIDTHPGINEETLQAIAICSLLVVVLRPDCQDYQGTSVIVELARMLSVSEMLLVVNKVLPSFDVAAYREQLEAAYEISVAEILPFSEEMMHLASSEIFSVRHPDHPLAKAVEAIGQQIVEQGGTPCPC